MATSREFLIFRRTLLLPLLHRVQIFSNRRQSRKIHNLVVATTKTENIRKMFIRRYGKSRSSMMKKILELNTEITRDHLTPELRLRLLTPNCRLYNAPVVENVVADDDDDDDDDDLSLVENLENRIFHDPFWSFYWPGGQALTRFVLDNPTEILNNSNVETTLLDVGCGCGASAIAAKMIGATRVVANDIDEVACTAAKLNAKLNNVDIEVTSENLLENVWNRWESTWDVILVGDLLYDEKTSEILIPWLEKASLRNGSRIYLGDPGRHGMTEALKSRMELRKTYDLPENVRRENNGYDVANVWQFK